MKNKIKAIKILLFSTIFLYIIITIKKYFYWNEFGTKYWQITSSTPIEEKYIEAVTKERFIKVSRNYQINSLYIENDTAYVCDDILYGKIFILGDKTKEIGWYSNEFYSKDSIVISFSKYGKKTFLYFKTYKPKVVKNKSCQLEFEPIVL